MFPQPNDDHSRDLQLTREERDIAQDTLREAKERLEQAAARIAVLMERDNRKTALLLDIIARAQAVLDMEKRR